MQMGRKNDKNVRASGGRHRWLLGLAMTLAAMNGSAASPAPLPAPGPATGLADSAALHATVFGTPPGDMATFPADVPLQQIDIALPWRRPVPDVYWFNRRLRVWFSAQPHAAPLAIVIAGTGSDGNTSKLSVLRAALYGEGFHVLTMPSPTFPNFIVAASRTGVAGDLMQDGDDLYAAMQQIVAALPHTVGITEIDVLGYSLGGANAVVVKSIDARERKLDIRRAVMIDPPVSLFVSMGRLDRLFDISIGDPDTGIERLYQRLYAQLANAYRASEAVQVDEHFLYAAATKVLKTDREFSAAIALTFRLALVDMYFAGNLYSGDGGVIDPRRPPKVGDPLDDMQRTLRAKSFSDYFNQVFAPYYLQHRAGATRESLIAGNDLHIIAQALANDPDYYAQANADDPILDPVELAWLKQVMPSRIVVYPHGGHLGNLGEKRQIADMLKMVTGRWQGASP